ncbi:MAG: histone [Candidatus Woesearchaeota archaeon]
MAEKHSLTLAAMGKIIKKAGAARVSKDAEEALREFLEKAGTEISKEAIKFASYEGRKTIKKSDIRKAHR